MKAAVVNAPGQTPTYAEFPTPSPVQGLERVDVSAAALSHVTRSRAAGTHYSSSGGFPFVAGVDGTGRLADGRRVYFAMPRAPLGTMAEVSLAPLDQIAALPDDLDDHTAAAIAIPGGSSWVAFKERAMLAQGETVLVNGATGAAGRLAVKIARHLGAAKVVATGRNVEALALVGADATVSLTSPQLGDELMEHFAAGVDVVIDYLWGASAEQVLVAAARANPDQHAVRYVEIGSASGGEITLPSPVLRSTAITLMGSGLGSIALPRFMANVAEMLAVATTANLTLETRAVPLSGIEAAWSAADATRTVVAIG